MKLQLTTPIKDYRGNDILDDKNQPITLRTIIDSAINAPSEEQPTSEQKSKVFQIGLKLWSGSEVDFTVDQLALIKELSGKALSALAYGRLCEIIDGISTPNDES